MDTIRVYEYVRFDAKYNCIDTHKNILFTPNVFVETINSSTMNHACEDQITEYA